MLVVNDLKKIFIKNDLKRKKVSFYANRGISFRAKEGEIIGILGPNGAGKTTLLRMIAGIIEPNDGIIKFGQYSYPKYEITIKKDIAYLSSNTKLYSMLTPYEFLKMVCDFYRIPHSKQEEKINKMVRILKLDKFLHHKMGKLSTGQIQRVNIARCLIHNPKYYILDEVTNGLDILYSQIVLKFLKKERRKGKIILYATHYLEEVESICDRIILLNNGMIVKNESLIKIKKETKSNNLRDAILSLIGSDLYD